MNRYINQGNKWLLNIVICFFVLLLPTDFLGQKSGAKITDKSSSTSNAPLSDLAILELDTNSKGFLFPRMTSSQRDAIKIDNIKDKGLAIFNITTDCIEYYNDYIGKWVSLCGETLHAEITILPSQCSEIKIIGDYYQNNELTVANGILVKVTTSKAGAYDIVAKSNNGYSFEAKGKFPDTGTFTVFLKGEGKPVIGYDVDANGKPLTKGDKLSLTINKNTVSCDVYVFVNKDMPIFTIISAISKGRYFTAEDVTSAESMTVNVNVTRLGLWKMKTDNDSGVTFSGEGVFTAIGNQTVTLKAIGRTNKAGNNEVTITSNSLVTLGEPNKTAKASYKGEAHTFNVVNCANATFSNNFYVNELVPLGTTMKVFVRALAPGKGITIKSGFAIPAGPTLWFKSSPINLVYDRNATGPNANIQEVTLQILDANRDHGATAPTRRKMFFMEEDGFNVNECQNPSIIEMVIGSRVATKITFNSPFSSVEKPGVKFIPPYTTVGTETYLDVEFYAGGTGTVNLSTAEINGIKFSGSVPITNGVAKGKIYATGTAEAYLPNEDSKFVLRRTDSQAVLGEINIDFVYRRMKVISYGSQLPFFLDSSSRVSAEYATALLLNRELFGWDGDVRVDGFEYLDGTGIDASIFNATGSTDSNSIKLKANLVKADIVTLTGLARKYPEKLDILYDYLQTEKFALIYNERYDGKISTTAVSFYRDFVSFVKRFDTSFTGVTGVSNVDSGFMFNASAGDKIATIFDTKFIEKYPSGSNTSLNSALFGFVSIPTEEGSSSFYFNKVPAGFSALLGKSNNMSEVYGVVHNTQGVVLIGNYRPFHGYSSSPPSPLSLRSPINIQGNNYPAATTMYGPSTPLEVYNSYFFLNIIHWSIDYAQKNRVQH